jgi:hypothetical protein
MQSQPVSPRVFTLFSSLPPELRDKIWIHTVDGRPHVLPRPPVPELAVCHKAREILLKIYRPCFRPFRRWREDDTSMGCAEGPGGRTLIIEGMGRRSPRSPYANYKTDVLHLDYTIYHEVNKGLPLSNVLEQEAIENMQHVVMLLNAWSSRRHGGPARRNGQPPLPTRPDSRLVVTHFGALKMISLAHNPKMKVPIAPRSEEERREYQESRLTKIRPDDEVLAREKVALRARYAEGKILEPVTEPAAFWNPYFKFEQAATQWIEQKAEELPSWSKPEIQYATIVPDPMG